MLKYYTFPPNDNGITAALDGNRWHTMNLECLLWMSRKLLTNKVSIAFVRLTLQFKD